MATLAQNIQRAIDDFNTIEDAIVRKGVSIPDGTPTSEYGEKILSIETGVDTSGDTVVPSALREGYTAHDAAGQEITGTIPNYDGGDTVELTSPEGATLNTAGTYCEGDIEVIPNLQEKTATESGIVTADEGYSGLKSVDTTPVFEAGKKSEYDAFWDAYQTNGNRGNYDYAFGGFGWKLRTFNPKYSIDCNRCQSMFAQSYISGDLEKLFADRGLSFSTARAVYMSSFATYAQSVTVFPTIDVSSATDTPNLFQGCDALERVKVASSGEIKISNASFMFCRALTALTLDGTISFRGLGLSYSPLNKASIISAINALSSTTTGLPVTLRLAAVNTAFETSAGAADGSTSEEWTALIATKPNWTINLINS